MFHRLITPRLRGISLEGHTRIRLANNHSLQLRSRATRLALEDRSLGIQGIQVFPKGNLVNLAINGDFTIELGGVGIVAIDSPKCDTKAGGFHVTFHCSGATK